MSAYAHLPANVRHAAATIDREFNGRASLTIPLDGWIEITIDFSVDCYDPDGCEIKITLPQFTYGRSLADPEDLAGECVGRVHSALRYTARAATALAQLPRGHT